MNKLKIYLDNCCFNRPYNDQSNLVNFLETEAKLFIQDLILSGKLMLIWSFILDYENNYNPFYERKQSISAWKKLAIFDCNLCDKIINSARDLKCWITSERRFTYCMQYMPTPIILLQPKKNIE